MVDLFDVARTEFRLEDLGGPVVAVPSTEARVVFDVSGRLLQICHQPPPLQHLGEEVRGLLAGEVDPAELRHRVVAVLEKDALVEFLGAPESDAGVDREIAGDVEVADELVEEQTPKALVRT